MTPEQEYLNKKQDKEANIFAMCLLIPKHLIEEDLKSGIDLTDDTLFNSLCKKYGVTNTTMASRIAILNLNKK